MLMKLISKGAEGDLFLTTWINQKAVLKSRKKKDYRNASLDHRLRRQRTIRESEIISEVKKFGIHTPLVYFVDIENCNIIMQKIVVFWFVIYQIPRLLVCAKKLAV